MVNDMNSSANDTREAQEIVDALRQIQASDALKAEAAANPERVLDRLNLTPVARHAVALGISALAVGGVVTRTAPHIAMPTGFWL